MSNFGDFIFNEVPWFLPVLSWIGGIVVIFLILSIPSYFILFPFFKHKKKQLSSFIELLVDKFKKIRTERTNHLDSAADEFLKDGGLQRIKNETASNWIKLTKDLTSILSKLYRILEKASKSLYDLSKKISTLEIQIKKSEFPKLPEINVLPEHQDPVESVIKKRVAYIKLILSSIVLLSLMIVNTGMLSEILLDLGVVPIALTFLGIRLAYVFAFILTLVEAGLGVAHGATRSENTEKISIFPLMITICAVIVACVEGFFYSRVAPTGSFTLPFLNYELPQSHLFFFWGFVLVITLFSLGLIAFNSAVTIISGTPFKTLRGEFNKLKKKYEQSELAFRQAHESLSMAIESAKNIDKIIQGPAKNAESVHQELIRVSDRVENLKKFTPEWVNISEKPLARSEVHNIAQRAGIWLVLSTISLFVMTLIGFYTFASFYSLFPPILLWLIAFVQAVYFFSVGLMLGTTEIVVQDTKGEKKVLVKYHFSRLLAYFLVCAILIFYTWIFFNMALPKKLGSIWGLNFLVGLLLTAAGNQLIPFLNVISLWLLRIWNVVVIILQMTWLALLRIIQFIIIILENLFYLLSMPLLKLFHKSTELKNDENFHLKSFPPRQESIEKMERGDDQ